MTKKRILFSGEASFLATGFSTFNREVLKLIHASDKYEIAEYGAYGSTDQPEAKKLPWRFYGALPTNQSEQQLYGANPQNQFGVYKWDAVVADFQPDWVIDFRDPWMLSHILSSRFRPNYKTIINPTVDSHPQKREWIDMFKKSDVLLTYSKYAEAVLKNDGANVFGVCSPGVDLDVFKPLDRAAVKKDWGIQEGALIIGTVMRNQRRKLFPELFAAYATLRGKYPKVEEIQRSVLLCHTSWPDAGWDIPDLLERYGVKRDVIFTYHCDTCKRNFFSWFLPSDNKGNGQCVFCGNMTAHMPNTHNGIESKELAEVYNLMDVYVQTSICEGWGVPIVESKGCGVPGIYQNYSAMEDHVKNGGGLPLKIGRMYVEAETMAERSLPDRADLVGKLHMLLTNEKARTDMGKEARAVAEKMHSWHLASNKIIEAIESQKILDRATTWDARPKFKLHNRTRPNPSMDNVSFVLFCYRNILGREPDQPGFVHWMKQLEGGQPKDHVESYFRNEIDSHNRFEEIRFKKSIALRGMKAEKGILLKSNILPGVFT